MDSRLCKNDKREYLKFIKKEQAMKYRIFGRTGFKNSEVGLGCWQIGASWGNVPDDTAMKILNAAYENGVNFYDTADIYGKGRSENFIGKLIKGKYDVFVATKVGKDSSLYPDNFTQKAINTCVDGSLKRLGRDCLDLLQLHCVPLELLQQGDIFELMRKLKQQGKIKNWGASVESMDEARLCIQQADCISLQIIFNIFRQKPIDAIFAPCKEKNIALIIRLPVASGLLTGKFTKQSTFAQNDHRTFNRDGQAFNVGETFAGLPFELGVDLADELKQYVPDSMTMAQFALRWILDFDAVSVIIPGASKPKHAIDNAKASDLPPLSEDLHKQLKDFYEQKVKSHIRGVY
jgi:aryl-alcohol dehydrogenase-like predicted oxidoreductase